ncbi:hypothetical protein XENOCAPTIV_002340 [Xenoophorus captivus]|uniref:Uncharacterized protein n=1 Tax=Xenoophorus captivus TaxID=1517983 RepID=A0ABV0QZ22_9TELE
MPLVLESLEQEYRRDEDWCGSHDKLGSSALDWIQETGDVYLATHSSPGDSSEETQKLLNDYHHFRLSAKVRSVCLRDRKEDLKKL